MSRPSRRSPPEVLPIEPTPHRSPPRRLVLGRRAALACGVGVACAAVVCLLAPERSSFLPLALRGSAAFLTGYIVALAAFGVSGRFAFAASIWRRFRPRMLAETSALLVVTVSLAFALGRLLPATRWSWVGAAVGSRNGALVGLIGDAVSSPDPWGPLAALAFLALLALAIPHLAYVEESVFRRGVVRPGAIAVRSLLFGLSHAAAGLPLNFALALTVAGLFYGRKYARAALAPDQSAEAALLHSTTYHALYNTTFVGLFALVVAIIFLLELVRAAIGALPA